MLSISQFLFSQLNVLATGPLAGMCSPVAGSSFGRDWENADARGSRTRWITRTSSDVWRCSSRAAAGLLEVSMITSAPDSSAAATIVSSSVRA